MAIDFQPVANMIYFGLFIFGLVGSILLYNRKLIVALVLWISIILNLFFYLYLMGNYRFYPKIIYPIVNKYWFWINLGLFVLLIINFIKNKYAKTKSD